MAWLDDDIKTYILSKKVETYQKAQKNLTDEQIAEIIPEFQKHFKAEMEKPEEKRKLFKDKYGGYIVIIRTQENHAVKKDKKGDGYFYAYLPLLNEDAMIFMNYNWALQIKKNMIVVIRGWVRPQYRDLGSQDYHEDEKAYCKKKGIESIDDLDPGTWERKNNITVWQILKAYTI